MNTVDIDFEAWIDLVSDDLPDLDHLCKLVEIIDSDNPPRVVICGRGINVPAEVIKQLNGLFDNTVIQFNPENTNTGDPISELAMLDRRYMLLEPELKPLRQDPFWTQQGKRKKGKRGRY